MIRQEQIYYHVTLLDNVGSIRAKGLVPQLGERSVEFGETTEAVYLFPSKADMDNALMNWLGEWYCDKYGEDCELAILEIRLPPEISVVDEGTGYEVLCKTVISPEHIRFFDEFGKQICIEPMCPSLSFQIQSAVARIEDIRPKDKAPEIDIVPAR